MVLLAKDMTSALLSNASIMKVKLDSLDILFSEFIRRRAIVRTGGCERCLTPKHDIVKENGDIFPAWKELQCAHLISRWHKSIRWDEDAALGLCGGCHMWIDHEAEEKLELLDKKVGADNVLLLKARARTPARYIDKNALEIYFKIKIKELEEAIKEE